MIKIYYLVLLSLNSSVYADWGSIEGLKKNNYTFDVVCQTYSGGVLFTETGHASDGLVSRLLNRCFKNDPNINAVRFDDVNSLSRVNLCEVNLKCSNFNVNSPYLLCESQNREQVSYALSRSESLGLSHVLEDCKKKSTDSKAQDICEKSAKCFIPVQTELNLDNYRQKLYWALTRFSSVEPSTDRDAGQFNQKFKWKMLERWLDYRKGYLVRDPFDSNLYVRYIPSGSRL